MVENQKTVAIIPARGGSKGIPEKNIRRLAGKPLVAYPIESARQAPSVNRVVVSTDDARVAEVARNCRAEVVLRPTELSGGTASSESALLHALDHLRKSENYESDLLVFLQCTSPLTLPEDIEGTVRTLLNEGADSSFAVAAFHHFLWKYDNSGNAIGINHDRTQRQMRQDRDPQFIETGAVYVMRTPGFRAAKHRFFGKTAMYVMPSERCLEIDEPNDFLIAEALVLAQQKKPKLEALPDRVAALVLDFDGVFTNNQVLVFEDGREGVVCDRGDGWGLAQLRKRGLPILVLSSEENLVVQARCDKLGLLCMQGVNDKLTALEKWLRRRGLDSSQVVYLGNDVNDIGCLKGVGCGVVVANAHSEAQAVARLTLSQKGGRGAIRELTDLIVEKMKG